MNRQGALLIALGVAGALYLLSKTSRGDMAISQLTDGLAKLLDREEGERLTVYPDTGGAWTVGKGHLVTRADGLYPYTEKRTITKAESDALFEKDTAWARAAVASGVKVPISTNKKIALSSLAFNIGGPAFAASTLLKLLNAGNVLLAAEEFGKWVHDNGKVDPVLVARREREKKLFLT